MMALSAYQLGFSVVCFSNIKHCPLAEVTPHQIIADYDEEDEKNIQNFIDGTFAITCEFENIPHKFLQKIEEMGGNLAPSSRAFFIAQNRIREKTFLREICIDTAKFLPLICDETIEDLEGLEDSTLKDCVPEVRGNINLLLKTIQQFRQQTTEQACILKTSEMGYDGKGQLKISGTTSNKVIEEFLQLHQNKPLIIEEFIGLSGEISCIIALSKTGQAISFPIAENTHNNGILVKSACPISHSYAHLEDRAKEIALKIATELGITGLLAVEFFITKQGQLLVNEIAPRPHNSGHYSMDGCVTSQFEQLIRAIAGLPLGDVALLHNKIVMHNLIGEEILQAKEILAKPQAKLHDYGKINIQTSRKMGHYNEFSS